ncbi:MAG: protein-L-isoaspartate O-methyltransferase [Zestosphaera tikiterensis]|uniref:Protein-L-isoaspartate O-methyltransferase n=1 Tax=Zestosphaera tikiterensis TaxID=1973259 RepID=A0A2R7Y7L4_9CREN|nr:MAG: protein-L-isoaspartate O-methyltransferase [Zestosphaera tikiterensis]
MSLEERKMRLIEALIDEGILKSEHVIEAMKKVPREEFVLEAYRESAYLDEPLPIGYGQTISAPHMVALMTELLQPKRGDKVLEIGTGSGYQAAVLAEIVKPEGHVWSVERIAELAEFAKNNLRKTGYDKYVTVIVGDGSKGYEEQAPYDKIIVTAAAPTIPEPLLTQLKPGGRLLIPVGDLYMQILKIVDKDFEGRIKVRDNVPCVFVPLIGEYGFRSERFP